MSLANADTAAPEQANLSNWLEPPFNRWAFHNVREIVACDPIANAPGDVWALPTALKSLDRFALKAPNGSELDLAAMLKATSTDGIVILQDGQIVYEAYDNGTTAHTPHILMSATKAVVGLLVGVLREAGRLDVDALVSDYVPEIAPTAYQGATIRNLMDMRTGIVLDRHADAYEAATGWTPVAADDDKANYYAFFQNLTGAHKPHGGPFSYISANTDLLGWVIERAAGQTVAELISAHLWRPLGAEDAAYITVDRKGLARCTGGLCATVRDLARIGQLVVDGGARGETQIVPKAWLEDIADGGDHEAWRTGEWGQIFAFAGSSLRYRSGWYMVDDDPKLMFAMGIHGQNLFVDRANRIVIAKMSSQKSRIDYAAVPMTHRAVDEIRRRLVEPSL